MRNEKSYPARHTGYSVRRFAAGRAVSFLALVLIGVIVIGAELIRFGRLMGTSTWASETTGVVLTDFIPGADNQGEAVARYDAAAPDFALAFSEPTLSVPRGTGVRVTLNISRSAGLLGEVTITASDTSDLRIKVKPGSVSTRDTSVSFKTKVKGSAATGRQEISFTGKSDFGATRTTQLDVVVE